VYVFCHSYQRGRRRLFVGLVLVIALLFTTVGTLFAAGTTGTISGTITDTKSAALAGVTVTAVAPTGRYSVKTDQKGFYSFTGVQPDTYTVSFELAGYQGASVTGVSVYADQNATVSNRLDKSLTTIGRVSARSAGGAYQPNQPTDTYTVTSAQISNTLGSKGNTDESQLLASLPGASFDSSGYPVLRGGRENEEGFQFEGIDYTEPFTHQFVNALSLNGVQSLQLTPGAGDASNGNSGTGVINLIAKRGTYPGFGSIYGEAGTGEYFHQLQLEYGIASANGRLSNYISYQGSREGRQYGPRGQPAAELGEFYTGRNYQVSNDLVDNLVYKFGNNLNQSLQFFYETSNLDIDFNYGGITGLNYKSADPRFLNYAGATTGLSAAQVQSVLSLGVLQPSITSSLNGRHYHDHEPNETFKVQYSNNIDPNTFFTTKFYKVNAVTIFDQVFLSASPVSGQFYSPQGGLRTGVDFNVTKQLNKKNLLQVGGKYEFDSPVLAQYDPIQGFLDVSSQGINSEVYDFVTSGPCPVSNCGYLGQFFPGGKVPTTPAGIETAVTTLQQWSVYGNETYSPTDRLKIQAGLRLDAANFGFPDPSNGLYHGNVINPDGTYVLNANGDPLYNFDNATKRPRILEPRLAFTYQLTPNDAVRAAYGRSVEFPPIGDVDLYGPVSYFAPFAHVPSYNNLLGPYNPANPAATVATTCGVNFTRTCRNYADQLYWENANGFAANGFQPAKPETFNNYDASYSHQFPGNIAMKVTGFYTRGYDALVQTANPKIGSNGQPILDPVTGVPQLAPPITTNLGRQQTTGIEFLLTREVQYGLGGQLSATYINEFSNILPGQTSEDFFPSIPPASLQAGSLYRVGFLTPFTATASLSYKSKGGLRVVPYVQYTRGYPIGQGLLTQAFVNGKATNVPNTNVTNPGQLNGAAGAPTFVDPANPGTITNPVLVASRGTPETSSPAGVLSSPQFDEQLTVEYTPPHSRSTFGVQIFNPFNNIYNTNIPAYNQRYQPVADGISGPNTGQQSQAYTQPAKYGYANYPANRYGQNPYLIDPNSQPFRAHIYYQLSL